MEKMGWEVVDKTIPAKVDKTTPAPKVDKTKADKADKSKAAKVGKTRPPGHFSVSSSPDWGDSSSSSSSSNPGDLDKRSRSSTPENMKITEEYKLEKKKKTPLAKGVPVGAANEEQQENCCGLAWGLGHQ